MHNAIAIIMIVQVVGSLVLIISFFELSKDWKVYAGAFFVAILSLFLGVFSIHSCDAGQPLHQIDLTAAIAPIIFILVGKWKFKISGCIFMIVIGNGNASMYSSLVHESGITGNPESIHRKKVLTMSHKSYTIDRALADMDAYGEYPAGWVGDVYSKYLPKDFSDTSSLEDGTIKFWHTFMTNLYKTENSQYRMWFTGGQVTDQETIKDKLEWKQLK